MCLFLRDGYIETGHIYELSNESQNVPKTHSLGSGRRSPGGRTVTGGVTSPMAAGEAEGVRGPVWEGPRFL